MLGKNVKNTWLIVATLVSITILTLASCSSPSENAKLFLSADDALAAYESFWSEISKKNSASTSEIIDFVNSWHEITDSASSAFARDTVSIGLAMQTASLNDSVCKRMEMLIDSRNRTLDDYIQIARFANKVELNDDQNRLVRSFHSFFSSMDSLPPYDTSAIETVFAYNKILRDAVDKGFHSKTDVMDFLKEEDRAFRSFLMCLPSLGNVPLESVRVQTAEAIDCIIALTDDEPPVLSKDEAVLLVSMRINRRLMQNAVQCINYINGGRVNAGKEEQRIAYMWMLLQPWITFDDLSYATMSNAQMRIMYSLANQSAKAIAKIDNPPFPIDFEELPYLLIKTFVIRAL